MLGFTQQERKRRGEHTWWVLVVGEETDEDPMKDGAALSPPGKGRPRKGERAKQVNGKKLHRRWWRRIEKKTRRIWADKSCKKSAHEGIKQNRRIKK